MNGPGDDDSKNSDENSQARHETARQLTEDALEAYVKGDLQKGNQLVEEAKRTDSSAVEEVIQDLDEDAESDHRIPDQNR